MECPIPSQLRQYWRDGPVEGITGGRAERLKRPPYMDEETKRGGAGVGGIAPGPKGRIVEGAGTLVAASLRARISRA